MKLEQLQRRPHALNKRECDQLTKFSEREHAMKPSKKLALQFADLLDLSALAPDEDLDRQAVREVIYGLAEGQLDSFQLGL